MNLEFRILPFAAISAQDIAPPWPYAVLFMNVASNIVPLLPDHLIAPPTPVEARFNLKTDPFITPRVLLSHETAPALTVAKLLMKVDLRILPSVVFSHLTAPP